MAGLRPPSLRENVSLYDPRTLQEAVGHAREAIPDEQKFSARLKANSKATVVPPRPAGGNGNPGAAKPAALSPRLKDVPKPKVENKPKAEVKPTAAAALAKLTCHTCGILGHISPNCPNKADVAAGVRRAGIPVSAAAAPKAKPPPKIPPTDRATRVQAKEVEELGDDDFINQLISVDFLISSLS